MLSDTDKAWMAGFLDGEGCLTISKQVRKNRPSPAYRAAISVSNTDRRILQPFSKEYGGSIYNVHERRKDKRGLNWADAFDWCCPMSSSKRILSDLRPYLRLKSAQADIITDFIEKKFPRKSLGVGKGSSPLSGEEIAYRERLRVSVHSLNKKGQDSRRQGGGFAQ